MRRDSATSCGSCRRCPRRLGGSSAACHRPSYAPHSSPSCKRCARTSRPAARRVRERRCGLSWDSAPRGLIAATHPSVRRSRSRLGLACRASHHKDEPHLRPPGPWFRSHELVASSLLFVYDGLEVSREPAIYLIDLAKTSAPQLVETALCACCVSPPGGSKVSGRFPTTAQPQQLGSLPRHPNRLSRRLR